jgi:ABC-type phosphate transport system substrate-binding protein
VLVARDWRVGVVTVALFALAVSADGAQEFQVVVHPSVRGTRITRANLSALFTGKTSQWGDKTQVMPVDQSAKAPVRRAFAAAVIGLSMGELQMYWQRRVAADRVFPPPIKGTDQEVLGYVAATAGAIGYVSPDAAIPESVRVLTVID